MAACLAAGCTVVLAASPATAQLFEDLADRLVPGTQTVQDPQGSRLLFNVTSLGTNSVGGETAAGFFTTTNGTRTSFTLNETVEAGGASTLETLTATLNGQPLSCTFDKATGNTVNGNCGPFLSMISDSVLPTAVAASEAAAAEGTVRSQALAVTAAISDRIRAISRDMALSFAPQANGETPRSSYRGIAAGSNDARWTVWGDASGAFLRNDTAIGYSGNSVVALAGIDYLVDKSRVAGFVAGYTHGDLRLKPAGGPRVSDGAVLGPYISYIIGSHASADAQFQYTRLSNRLTAPLAGFNAGFDGNRLTGAVNLNTYADVGSWKLTGYTGYAYTWEGSETSILNIIPGSSSNIRYGVWKVGAETGYQATPQLEAYVPLTFMLETTLPRDGTSRAALEVGLGLRYQATDNVKAGLLATTTEIKSHTQDVRVGANLRWSF